MCFNGSRWTLASNRTTADPASSSIVVNLYTYAAPTNKKAWESDSQAFLNKSRLELSPIRRTFGPQPLAAQVTYQQ
jgi:hypothetical protein